MAGYTPPRPTGNDKQARFMQSVWDRLWGGETRVNDVSGQRTNRTTRGTFTLGTPAAIGGGGGVIMQVVSYHQDATNGDYLVCQPDGGGATVNVAVDMHLQSSIVTQTNPDGTTWTYSTYVAATQTRSEEHTSELQSLRH